MSKGAIGVPFVLMGDRVHEGTFDFVGVPNQKGAHEAVTYLLSSGRNRIAALGIKSADALTAAGQGRHGHLHALKDAGMDPDPASLVVLDHWTRLGGAIALGALIDARVTFDEVFGFNDALALGRSANSSAESWAFQETSGWSISMMAKKPASQTHLRPRLLDSGP